MRLKKTDKRMTRLKDLAAHCGDPKTKDGDITALQLVRAEERSFAQNTEGGITALSFTPKEGETAGFLKNLTLGKDAEALHYLYLSGCTALESLVFEEGCTFPELTHLYLDGCNLTDIKIPAGCTELKQIYVQKQTNKLRNLVFEGNCSKLVLLDASDNDLIEFSLPNGFGELKYLYVNNNPQLTDWSTPNLPSLVTLSVKNNRLQKLPEHLIFSPTLTKLYAAGNAPKNIPTVFLGDADSYASQNCLKDARIWFTELRDYDSDSNKIVKLMLTGNGNAGKSSVLCALKNGNCDHDHSSTHGIQIDVVKDRAIEYNVWDFGGQEVYHGTHRLFMASEALQVILFDPETEDLAKRGVRIKDRVSNEQILNHPIEYWYETVNELSPKSAFFVVQNKRDINKKEDSTIRQYAIEKAKTEFVHVSAKTGLDMYKLVSNLQHSAKDLPDFGMSMPQSWLKVRAFFIENLKKEDASQKIMSKSEFQDLCTECKVNGNTVDLLFKYLHHNGFLYYHQNLGNKIIADQRWALAAIYKPLDREAAHYEEFKEDLKGKIRVRRLFEIFGAPYTVDEKWLFLDFMKSCGLCFQLNNRPDQTEKSLNDVYVFPEFLSVEKPETVQSDWVNKAKNVHILRCKMAWLNYFAIQSFISALGRKTKTENIWRNGIHVSTLEGWFKVEMDYDQKAIILSIEQAAMSTWLSSILEELKVSKEKWAWEMATDGTNFQRFDIEEWQQKDKIRPEKQAIHAAMDVEKKPITEKLPNDHQEEERQYILFLAANPTAKQLSFGNEHSDISIALSEKNIKSKFTIEAKRGTTVKNMLEAIKEFSPTIIHFVGHGTGIEIKNNKDIERGLIFHNSDYDGEKTLDAETLNAMFRRIKKKQPQLKIVVLNACYSEPQAKAISHHGIYAIGSNDQIGSFAARAFAAGFYRQYALKNDVVDAAEEGVTHAMQEGKEIERLIKLFYNGNEISL